MILLLKRLFIKDYQNTSDPTVRIRYGIAAGIFGVLTNVVLFLFKLFVGLMSHSITVIADAVNNLSDACSSVLTMIGFKLSSRPADKDHPYGHARYEEITALIVALLVLCVGVLFAKSSIDKIITPTELEISVVTYIVLVAAVAVKLWQYFTYLDFSKAIDSDALKADAVDSRNDIITTSSVILSMAVMQIFRINLDGWFGLIISVFVIISAIRTLSEVISPMLGEHPDEKLVESIYSLVRGRENVVGYHDLIIHSYGAGKCYASLHIEVDASKDIFLLHDMIDTIEREAHEELGILLTIHMDPVDMKDPLRAKLHDITIEALEDEFGSDLGIHDFRIVAGPTHTNILFDIVEPFGEHYDLTRIETLLTEKYLEAHDPTTYYFVINVDKKMD